MIYVYCGSLDIAPGRLKEWEGLLSDDRAEKMNRYRSQKDRTLSLISFLLMRSGLEREFDISGIPDIYTAPGGKPQFADNGLYFNISHCDKGAVCVIDKSPVGVDIQDYTGEIAKIRKRFLTGAEAARAGESLNELTRIWTMKEAYGKFYGFGLGYPFAEKDFSFIKNKPDWQNYEDIKMYSRQFGAYALTVCSKRCMGLCRVSEAELGDLAERKMRL